MPLRGRWASTVLHPYCNEWHQTPIAVWLPSGVNFNRRLFPLQVRSSPKLLVGHGLRCVTLFAHGSMSKGWRNINVISDVWSGLELWSRHTIPDKNTEIQHIFGWSILPEQFSSEYSKYKMRIQTPVYSFFCYWQLLKWFLNLITIFLMNQIIMWCINVRKWC